MNYKEAQRIVECLRTGIPPRGFVAAFTVGRENEIALLRDRLEQGHPGTLLLKANYGCGKSHLLQFVRETALEQNYAVSTVTIDSRSGVRFNRVDQIMAAVWRGLEVPEFAGETGPDRFLDVLAISERNGHRSAAWAEISNGRRWDEPQRLGSICVYAALLFWFRGKHLKEIAPWLQSPSGYKPTELGHAFRKHLPDRPLGSLCFRRDSYSESWAAIAAIDILARVAGMRGLIILFDEFEDVFNMNHAQHETAALDNLFRFYDGNVFSGQTYFAVTPDFEARCRARYQRCALSDGDESRMARLPVFSMSPLEEAELRGLVERIIDAHRVANAWAPRKCLTDANIDMVVTDAAASPVQYRARHVVKAVVRLLDDSFDEVA